MHEVSLLVATKKGTETMPISTLSSREISFAFLIAGEYHLFENPRILSSIGITSTVTPKGPSYVATIPCKSPL
jgi:hypothetical protein